jgi:threonine aldolase
MRFLAAQMEAYLADDLWLRNARHANAMAARLAAGILSIPQLELTGSPAANILFVRMPARVSRALLEEGFWFYPDRRDPQVVRLVTSFATTPEAVDELISAARRCATAS